VFEDQALGVIELASFGRFTPIQRDFLEQLMETIGVNVNTIIANARTDSLLAESQRLTQELRARSEQLQEQQGELRRSNAELARQNRDIEVKNFEIEQARQELEERAQQLALTSKYKSEFLANMSHELRTPLNSLLILARLLAQNPTRNLTPKQVEFANVIHSAGTDLLQLIDDILDLSKVEAGKMDISPERVPLRQLLDYVEATFRPLTTEKSLSFRITTATGVPADLLTDDSRLRQILRNLVSNAVKFTETGGVELRIEPADPDELPAAVRRYGSALAFHVTDTGIGIAEPQLETIFGAFQQADGTTSRKYGGTGLGLSISREIARLLGGEIRLQSNPGEGSTFTLFLPQEYQGPDGSLLGSGVGTGPEPAPIARPPAAPGPDGGAAAQPRAEPPRSEGTLQGRKVLIIDDDPRNIFALTGILEGQGMEVLYAEDGRAGLAALERHPQVDLVLMDVMMPEMDGYEALQQIRRTPQFAQLPVIAITARALREDREKCLAAGATDYLAKPVDTDRLLELVRMWIT
jgi:signal transduction histidine kinase